jgi:hypothetical protein
MNIEFCYTPEQQKLVERIDLISLPFISTYKNLTWYGTANGTPLTPVFVIGDIQNKVMIIKSFKIANYYHANSVDLYVTDGITTNAETVVAGARMDRLFDAFAGGTTIDFRINNLPVSFFQGLFSADVDKQSIYYKCPYTIQSLQLAITTVIYTTIVPAGATGNPDVKAEMEVYLI